ncbi:MAG: creatininase family protein [Rhizobiaceae bacterium]|nr:creatininase family protein [Rhizobiaceae bacterium]
MRLDLCTWREVEAYLKQSSGIVIPVGSNEQHGPIGLIGTDALCAQSVALEMAKLTRALVAPTLCYTPAPFNMSFPGTISISEETFQQMVEEIVTGLASQGFTKLYFLNGHGANLAPLKRLQEPVRRPDNCSIRIRSWWDFEPVNELRRDFYGDWEGMHATPSEVAITQATHRIVEDVSATQAPRKLSADYMKVHAGDKHGPADQHRRDFPDGRVGSHSALARPEHGEALLSAAASAAAHDYADWIDD